MVEEALCLVLSAGAYLEHHFSQALSAQECSETDVHRVTEGCS